MKLLSLEAGFCFYKTHFGVDVRIAGVVTLTAFDCQYLTLLAKQMSLY